MLGLSIVTPSLDQGDYLPACLSSVARLSELIPVEHLVIDGASTDGSVQQLEEFARSSKSLQWWSEPDSGQSDALNRGFARVSQDLVMWVNADDEVEPAGVAAAVRRLELSPDIGAVFGKMAITDSEGAERRIYSPPRWNWHAYLWLGEFLTTPTVIFRREFLERALPVGEELHYAMDYDFYLRLLRGVTMERRPDVLVRFRWHSESKTGSAVEVQRAEALAIRQAQARFGFERTLMAAVDGSKQFALRTASRGRWPKPY
jgi:glycosyltransferase involved in cell wall biosynthesis